MSKLTLLHINIIGVVMALIIAGVLWFTVISGAQEEIKTNQGKFDGVKGRADKLKGAETDLKKAEKEKIDTDIVWAKSDRYYMTNIGYSGNRVKDMMQLWWPNNGKSWPERFIKGFKSHMDG